MKKIMLKGDITSDSYRLTFVLRLSFHFIILPYCLQNNDNRGIGMSPWCCCFHIDYTAVTNNDLSTSGHLDTVTTFTSGGKLGLNTIQEQMIGDSSQIQS